MTVLPPSSTGADHDTNTSPFPPAAPGAVGSDGTDDGVADTATDGSLSPVVLVATTVNEYSVPLASPDTTHDVDAVTQVAVPGDVGDVGTD